MEIRTANDRVQRRRIREIAHERGLRIGLGAVKPEDKSEVSDRSQDRFINEKAKEVTGEMHRLVSQSLTSVEQKTRNTSPTPSANYRAT